MDTIVSYLVFPAVLTVVMETPILLIGFKKESYRLKYKLPVFMLVNVITNLLLNCSILIFKPDLKIVIAAEVLIVIAEALVYRRAFLTKYPKAFLISLLANAFSGIIGSILIRMVVQ